MSVKMCFMGRTCCRNNFMFLFHIILRKKLAEWVEHIQPQIKIHFTVKWRMTNYDKWKLWTVCTLNPLLMCHMCACSESSWRRRQWRVGSELKNVRMKWLYGSICNAIKWTLNMHNNPFLLFHFHLPACRLSLSLSHSS